MLSSFLAIVKTVLVLAAVIALANISLKYANMYMKKQNKIIKIIERVAVNNNSSLSIVEICNTYYLMSFAGNENKIIKELDKEEIMEIIEKMEKEESIHLLDMKDKAFDYLKLRRKS